MLGECNGRQETAIWLLEAALRSPPQPLVATRSHGAERDAHPGLPGSREIRRRGALCSAVPGGHRPTMPTTAQRGDTPTIQGYRLLRVLGEGGMSTVFLAEQARWAQGRPEGDAPEALADEISRAPLRERNPHDRPARPSQHRRHPRSRPQQRRPALVPCRISRAATSASATRGKAATRCATSCVRCSMRWNTRTARRGASRRQGRERDVRRWRAPAARRFRHRLAAGNDPRVTIRAWPWAVRRTCRRNRRAAKRSTARRPVQRRRARPGKSSPACCRTSPPTHCRWR